MAAKLEKTRTPGIFKRGSRYVFSYRVNGKQKWESCRTLDEARRAKQARSVDISRGEFEERSRITLHEYALEWVERYQGSGQHAIRPGTRDEYRRQLKQYALRFFGERERLTDLTPRRIAQFGEWLREQTRPAPIEGDKSRTVALSNATVKRIMAPLQACLSTAVREGLIRSNPAREVKLPGRAVVAEDEETVRAMSQAELATLSALIPEAWRLFFWLLTATGLRISEAVALEWRHLALDGSTPHVKVRQALVKGHMGPPKSRHGRREVPLDPELVDALSAHHRASEWPEAEHPVFAAGNGSPLTPGNVFRRVLVPAREEACLPWVGFHSFRHTCATLLFAEGRNVKQVQRWLGHHSPSFTLDTYIHLLDDGVGGPLVLRGGANTVQTDPTPFSATPRRELEAAA